MKQNEQDICNKLQMEIREQLTSLIDSDYCYLDVPYHSNIGDTLIWLGTVHFLKDIPHQCLGQHSIGTFNFRPLPKNAIILLHGGGNFGDMWRKHQNFRLKVIDSYPENRIIILPQTIHYESDDVFNEDVRRMNLHKNLIICARDNSSAEQLTRHGYTGQMLTLPDMAFCIDREQLYAQKSEITKEALLLLRKDKESPVGSLNADITSARIEIKDWPNQKEAYKIAKRYTRKHSAEETDTFFQTSFLPDRISEGVRFVSEYKMVYSTRLHVAILRLLLGLPVKMMDNSYGKNLTFYNTWLKDSELAGVPNEEEQELLDMTIYVHRQEQIQKKREKRIRLLTWALFLTIFILALEMLIAYLSTK